MSTAKEGLFEQALIFPDIEFQERLSDLIGLDDHKSKLLKALSLLTHPAGLAAWAKMHHPGAKNLVSRILRRPPLIVLAGDVGSGKTELATTIGDAVARQEDIPITLLPMSLSSRGQGRVGEMTQLISEAFEHVASEASKLKSTNGSRGAVILLVDEADALAQSRESNQMHHEDKAGVNAFIRGIDRIGNGRLPAAVIMCTNRIGALDPAIKRRAAEILHFKRPNSSQRFEVLRRSLDGLGFSKADIEKIVTETGPKKNRPYGFTYSDLIQRLLPSIVLDAYPTSSVEFKRALTVIKDINPTPPFNEDAP